MRLRFRYKGLVAIVVLLILVEMAMPGGRLQQRGYEVKSFNNMRQIAFGISAYADDNNGNLPRRLADLVPNYEPEPRVFLFQSPYTNSVSNVDVQAHKELIDTFSPYNFMKLPDSRIVVVERPGFWKDGKITYLLQGKDGKVVGDDRSCHVSPEEFAQRFASGSL